MVCAITPPTGALAFRIRLFLSTFYVCPIAGRGTKKPRVLVRSPKSPDPLRPSVEQANPTLDRVLAKDRNLIDSSRDLAENRMRKGGVGMKPYDKALDAIIRRVNMSMLHVLDEQAIAKLFDYLIKAGHRMDSPDRIGDYLRSKGATEKIAAQIQGIYEAIDALNTGGQSWDQDFLKSLIS